MELIQYFHTPSTKELASSLYITWAGHRICHPDHCIGPRVLNNYKIIFILKGKGTLKQENAIFHLREGNIFLLFPNVKHLYFADPDDPWEIMWVSFNGNICDDIMELLQKNPVDPVIYNASTNRIIELFKKVIGFLNSNEEPHALKSTGYFYLLLSEIIGLGSQTSDFSQTVSNEEIVTRSITFIEMNYYNDINVDMISKSVNYSRSYLSRLFKKSTGYSVPEYISLVRIKKAKRLLLQSSLNINEVAKSVGFNDPFYFSRSFKKITGVSPISYKSENSVILDKL